MSEHSPKRKEIGYSVRQNYSARLFDRVKGNVTTWRRLILENEFYKYSKSKTQS